MTLGERIGRAMRETLNALTAPFRRGPSPSWHGDLTPPDERARVTAEREALQDTVRTLEAEMRGIAQEGRRDRTRRGG